MRGKDIFINRNGRDNYLIYSTVVDEKKSLQLHFYFNYICKFLLTRSPISIICNLLAAKFYDKYLIVGNTWPDINPP